MDSVGDPHRIGRSCKRHLRAEGTSGASSTPTASPSAGYAPCCSVSASTTWFGSPGSTWRWSWSTSTPPARPPRLGVAPGTSAVLSLAGRGRTPPLTPWRPCGCRSRPSNLFPSCPSTTSGLSWDLRRSELRGSPRRGDHPSPRRHGDQEGGVARHAVRGCRSGRRRRHRPRFGKGRRRRQVPIGMKTARAMDRCVTARAKKTSNPEWFWVTAGGSRLQESGLATMLQRRRERAGAGTVYPCALRHTWAQLAVGNESEPRGGRSLQHSRGASEKRVSEHASGR